MEQEQGAQSEEGRRKIEVRRERKRKEVVEWGTVTVLQPHDWEMVVYEEEEKEESNVEGVLMHIPFIFSPLKFLIPQGCGQIR